tara:strand:+ start:541 stop:1314 length:774 start_codon:yes stop_codon:yes gene_type:complete
MKITILALIFSFFQINIFYAQTTATDFTTNDCDGNSHHLFSELDNGNVIVLAWVMPCGPCATHAMNAHNSVISYQNSHPDRVKFYMVDDYANTDCSSLLAWASSYGLGSCTIFSDASISMSDYGQNGMPKIVVVGGIDHKIYFNENSSTTGIDAAIDQALISAPTNIKTQKNTFEVKLFPNPVSDKLNISYNENTLTNIDIEIFNMIGERVFENQLINQKNTNVNYEIEIALFPAGTYFLRYNSKNHNKVIKFNVVH